MKFFKRHSACMLFLAVLLWGGIFIWQGLDFTDIGYFATQYQQFDTLPANEIWLTVFIGHWVGMAFGGKLISYKIADVLVMALTCLVVYLFLKGREFGSKWLWVICFVTAVFVGKQGGDWIGYNDLSALFYVVGTCSILKGVFNSSKIFLILGGFVLALNVFVRIPNVIGILLIFLIPLYGMLAVANVRETLEKFSVALLGCFFGLVLGLALLYVHNGINEYWGSVVSLLQASTNADFHHSGSFLVQLFARDHLRAVFLGSTFTAFLIFSAALTSKYKQPVLLVLCIALLSIALIYKSMWTHIFPGFLYFSLLTIFYFERNAQYRVTAVAAGVLIVLVPLGSNNGMVNAVYGEWLALPLVFGWLAQKHEPHLLRFVDTKNIAVPLICAVVVCSLYIRWNYSYRDSANRFAMVYSVDHPLLEWIYTTKHRAEVVDGLLIELRNWVAPGDVLFAYPEIPTLHFITKTRPFLVNPWPFIISKARFSKTLGDKEKESELPIVVRSLVMTNTFTWPDQPISYNGKTEQALNDFMAEFIRRNCYSLVWSNYAFEILAPNKNCPR